MFELYFKKKISILVSNTSIFGIFQGGSNEIMKELIARTIVKKPEKK